MIQDGYSICFNEWVLDTRIKNELPLLLMISSLTAKTGECFAGNKYFAELFDCTEVSVSQKIAKLVKLGYLEVDYEKRGAEIIKRKLRIKNFLTVDLKTFYPSIKKNVKDNNIIFKNNNNNNNNTKKAPTYEEVVAYAQSRGRVDIVAKFWDFFNATDWVDSNGKKVKNWKAKFLTWESHTEKPKEEQPRTWWRE